METRLVRKKRLLVRNRRTTDSAPQIQSPPITPMSEDMMRIVETAKTIAPGRPTDGLMLHSNVCSESSEVASMVVADSFTERATVAEV